MASFAGAIGFTGTSSPRAVAERLARRCVRYASEACRELVANDWMALFAIEREDEDPVVTGHKETRGVFWAVAEAGGPSVGSVVDRGTGPDGRAPDDSASRRVDVLIDEGAQSCCVRVDRLGSSWVYVAELPEGVMFASDFGALAMELGRRLTIDHDTLLMELAVGYTPDDRTMFNEIRIIPAGGRLEVSALGQARISGGQVDHGDRYAGWSDSRKFRRLDDIYARIAREIEREYKSELVLSVSAGFDSRYALALLEQRGLRAALCTFGDPASEEVRKSQAFCARVDRTTGVFAIPPGDWDQWRRSVELLGNAGMTQWAGWAESWLSFIRRHGRYVLIGYLGDALSGKHLGPHRQQADWIRFWIDWSSEGGWRHSPLLTREARVRLEAAMEARFRECAAGARYAFPHQQALHLDLYGRQRRWVAGQPALLSRCVTPVLFFYDRELMEFWMNLPVEDLVGQRLYLAYAEERYPRLFARGEGKRSSVALRTMRRALRLLAGDRAQRRPPVVDHRKIIAPNVERIVALARDVGEVAEIILDVRAFCAAVRGDGRGTTSAGMIIRAVNVFLLMALARGTFESP